MKLLECAAAVLALTALATRADGQSYPARPIMLVNPYAAGGPADVLARTIANAMSDELGQQIVLLNKAGAATAIAASHVAHAAPDGYTLLLSTASPHIVTPALIPKLDYDGMRDFAFVARVALVPNVLVVRAGLPVKSVPDLIALAKTKPGELTYGSVGNGSQPHLAGELFKQMTGTDLNHIPYKGAAPATVDLLSGHIDLGFLNAPPLLPHIASGQLRALAVTTRKRIVQLPDIPTLDELGLTGFDIATWYGISAPAATPPAIIDKLAKVLRHVLQSPDIAQRLVTEGAEAAYLPPAEFLAYVREDSDRLTRLIKSAHITIE